MAGYPQNIDRIVTGVEHSRNSLLDPKKSENPEKIIYTIVYYIYIDLIVPTFQNQHVAVKKRQLSGTTKVVPPGGT